MADIKQYRTRVVFIGGGPGGYSGAFRAADLGLESLIVESEPALGGVCLNVGCIPSKALLHVAKVMDEAMGLRHHGVSFGEPTVDLEALRSWKNKVVAQLTGGLQSLAKQRRVEVVRGFGVFLDDHTLEVREGQEEGPPVAQVHFQEAVIAVGSAPVRLPFLPQDGRIWDSTAALELRQIPPTLLVLGGGIIGMEMATVYARLGSAVSVVELTDSLLLGADKDLTSPLQKRMSTRLAGIHLKTRVVAVSAEKDRLAVVLESGDGKRETKYVDVLLSAVGRSPNGKRIGAEKAGVFVDERGFIPVDSQMRTNQGHIYAIGDVVGNPMLAHKAIPQGRLAAEVIAGKPHHFDVKCIPSVAYTDPEVAWVGLSEQQAAAEGRPYEKALFPWAASGRALSMGREEGFTKLLLDPKTHEILGAGIVGVNAGDLIAEVALAIEMGCEAEDIALTVHPHPTVSETVALCAEVFEGTITDLYLPKRKH